ncbi:MAG: 4Fe-4S binding protein [Treponema sp.]|nr:4Fe-4S binding protein [Treponema sp.]
MHDDTGSGHGPAAGSATPTAARNLLSFKPFSRFIKSRWYPGIFQYPTLGVFVLIMYQLLAGPRAAHDNFGTALTWVLWWPLLPIIFLFLGRFWCTLCPFGKLNDLVQRFVGNNKPAPAFLKKYGIWLIDAMFIAITWSDHVFGIVENPIGSGILLLLITLGVVVSGALWERRTFCRNLCFLGGLAGNYSRAGMFKLNATPAICATCTTQSCYKGNPAGAGGRAVPGCPMFVFPKTMDTTAECNLCANCVKACPNDSIQMSFRTPTEELWSVKKPRIEVSFLAMVIMGIVFVQNITMLSIWNDILGWFGKELGITNYPLIFTLSFIVAMALPVGSLFLTGRIAGIFNKDGMVRNFTLFGFAIIPLDMAGHIAHNLFHLLAEGKAIWYTALQLFGKMEPSGASTAIIDTATITALQYIVVLLGALGSAYAAWRIAKRNYGEAGNAVATTAPYAVLIALLTVANLYLFSLPMAMRM